MATDFEIIKRKCKFHDINREDLGLTMLDSNTRADETVEIVSKNFLIR